MPGLDYVSSYIPAWRPSLSRHATELGVDTQEASRAAGWPRT